MSYVELGILLLKLANGLLAFANNRQQFTAGQDAEIARTSAATLKLTAIGKKLTETIDAKDAAGVGGLLDDLERG